MLDDVKNGRIEVLLFSKLARLARNTKQFLEFADIFNACRADLVSIFEPVDTSTPGGRLFYTVLAALAQWEREEIVERINNSVEVRAAMGRPLNGKASLGYCWVSKRMEAHQQHSALRSLIFHLFAFYGRLRTVAKMLNSAGFRTPSGALFTCRTVRRLIRDRTPVGLRRSYHTTRKGRNSVALRPEEAWRLHPVKAIVSERLWGFCNQLLDMRRSGHRPGRQPSHLFSGLVNCHCGRKMYVLHNTATYVCERCRSKVTEVQLDSIFASSIYSNSAWRSASFPTTQFFLSREEFAQIYDLLIRDFSSVEKGLHALDDLHSGGFIATSFEAKQRQLNERLSQLKKTLAQVEISGWLYNDGSSAIMEVSPADNGPAAEWENLDFVTRRKAIEILNTKVSILSSRIVFHLCIPSGKVPSCVKFPKVQIPRHSREITRSFSRTR